MSRAKTGSLLRVRGLEKEYPNGFKALHGIDLDVEPGEFVVILGLSGAGKSTFIRCINRLIEPTGGSIEFQEEDVTHVTGQALRDVRSRMGMIFQQFNLIKRATVLTNVLTGALRRTGTGKAFLGLWSAEDKEEAMRHLALVGLEKLAHRRVMALSGGQQQRVAIARALMQRPRMLLADEPVASLDPQTSHSVMKHLKHMQEEAGISVIANLHFLSLAREYGTRVVALRAGEKVFEGHPSEITDERFKQIYGEQAVEVEIQ